MIATLAAQINATRIRLIDASFEMPLNDADKETIIGASHVNDEQSTHNHSASKSGSRRHCNVASRLE
ncbi:hypothetical protein [Paraburkholderia youngii]|uniref:hypothetical protein n=1 Tax=Paraburkholderia youngii TaxID=2782701 RepID=UPI003D245F21